MSARCLFCAAESGRMHHPTARDHLNRYLDPELRFPTCHDHHELVGDDRRTLGLEKVTHPLTWIERVEVRLRRVACDVSRLAAAYPQHPALGKAARALVRWADELRRVIVRLDERDPSWRDDRGFYPPDAPPQPAVG